jgi:type I restriction enzyme S subunit
MAVGRCALTTRPTAINQDLKALLLTEDVDRRFFIRLLRYHGSVLDRVSVGSTVRGITLGDLLSLKLSYPEAKLEQSRIAAVLDTVDEAIAKTEAVIAKLKQVRAGLLHDLLTRGLDENGQLRDPIAHPEQFQDSPIGRIPRGWNFESLGARLQRNAGIIQTGPFGSQLHAHEYITDGVPVVMPQDMAEGSFNDTNIARIPKTKAEELRRHRLRLGDLVFARRGDLSRCSAVTERELGWLCGTGCLLMRFEQVTLSPSWLSLAYRHDFGQRQIAERAVGTTMVNLNTALLAHLVFAFPTKEEQEEIVQQVADADALIQTESTNLAKLNLLKSALMTDLLTGRVRVPADLEFG